ncbi:hypothetical protein ACFPIJ_62790 [Dactylosporangium cerinum]|uniref:Uncharacterized protein n=1 Tax=Dactylosporangium cerinum TaxID=1434730 RepID=A0ABV9WIV6_9ACTN
MTAYTDRCAPCQAEQEQRLTQARQSSANQVEAAWDRVRSAAQALADADAPGLTARQQFAGVRKAFFSHETLYDDLEPAWPVTDCTWDVPESRQDGGGERLLPTGVTRNGDLVPLHNTGWNEQPVRKTRDKQRLTTDPGNRVRSIQRTAIELNAIAAQLERRLNGH